MIPLLARKYLYRYLVAAVVLPVLARLLILGGAALEKRSGRPNIVSTTLTKAGSFAQRRVDKAARKDARSARNGS